MSALQAPAKMLINGAFVESKATEFIDVHNPATQEVVSRTPKCTQEELQVSCTQLVLAYTHRRRRAMVY